MEHRAEFDPGLSADLLIQLIGTAERLGDDDLLAMGRQVATELLKAGEQPPVIGPSTTPPDPADTGHSDQEGT